MFMIDHYLNLLIKKNLIWYPRIEKSRKKKEFRFIFIKLLSIWGNSYITHAYKQFNGRRYLMYWK